MPTGHIYKILNTIDNDVYIGSTFSQLCRRMVNHRSKSKLLPSYKNHCQIHIKMNELGIEVFYIELIKKYDNITREELRAKEGKYIRYYKENYTKGGILNKRIENRSQEQYHIDNRDDINKKGREIYKLGKEKETETGYKYREDHKIWCQEIVKCECGKMSTRGYLSQHKKKHNGPDYVECEDCDMKYTKNNKRQHYRRNHPETTTE